MWRVLLRVNDVSLKFKIIFASFAVALIGLALVVWLVGNKNFNFAKETTTNYAQATLKNQARILENKINLGFENVANIAILANQSLRNLTSPNANRFCDSNCSAILNGYLKQLLSQNGLYQSAFVKFFNGEVYTTSSSSPKYIESLTNDEINALFKDSETQAIFIPKLKPKPKDSADKTPLYAPVYLLNKITYNSHTIGISGILLDLKKMGEEMKQMKILESGFIVLLSQNSVVLHHKFFHTFNREMENVDKSANEYLKEALLGKEIIFDRISPNTKAPIITIMEPLTLGTNSNTIHWVVFANIPLEEMLKVAKATRNFATMISLLVLVLICVVMYLVGHIIYKRLNLIKYGLQEFFDYLNNKRDNFQDIPLTCRDELGAMGKTINQNAQNIKFGLEKDQIAIKESLQVVAKVEQGDLKVRIEANPNNPNLLELKEVLNTMLDSLQHHIGSDLKSIAKVHQSFSELDFTKSLENPKGEVEIITNKLGEEVAKMLRFSAECSNTLHEKSSNLRSFLVNLTKQSDLQTQSLQASSQTISKISQDMQDSNTMIKEVARQSDEIKNILKVIQDIADQTNLLALNAAIEAARAGEHGRGFAVVADEVRKLAERTGKSLSEIEAYTNTLVQSINQAGDNINHQASAMEAITNSIAEVEQITQQNNQIAKDVNVIGQDVAKLADAILEDINKKKY
ncbi:methyl-accepting chemotaxis protein [Helicobacter sp. UBA3407]|uniref:methyl-accepting chemotaxis protein n=2 Tax=Helicobacter sp. UBA3407 TaxID=1946588 RepID=UPI00260A1B07|nr:methyl-accepting chemotaxis protein [Helicobacter sp. UBA3407]